MEDKPSKYLNILKKIVFLLEIESIYQIRKVGLIHIYSQEKWVNGVFVPGALIPGVSS